MPHLTVDHVSRFFWAGLRPTPMLTVDEWADRHYYLSSKSSSEPGKFRTSRTPYLREIMRSLSAHDPCQRVVFVAGAQVGKSSCGLAWVGYAIDNNPGPILLVQPTVDMAKRFSKQRIAPLVDESPQLQKKLRPSRERDGGNTLLSKEFPGGILMLAGANAASGLRSMPISKLFCDEIDSYVPDLDGEGDPVELAEARTRTFSRRKVLLTSTPTIANISPIWQQWEDSDQRQYHVPCPHCGHLQILIWENIRFDESDPKVPPVFICQGCGVGIEEGYKTEMLANGVWIPGNPGSDTRGFHLSSLYSPLGWFSWKQAVKMWKDSQGDATKMKAFVNTVLGEPFSDAENELEWESLYSRRENYPVGIVPPGVALLTAGVDVQGDRLEVSVVGWGRRTESWVVTHDIFYGDTSQTDVWRDLFAYLKKPFPTADGRTMSIARTGIDTSYNTQQCYGMIREQRDTSLLAMKGRDKLNQAVSSPSSVDVSFRGKTIKNGLKLWTVGSSHLKSWLYGKLRLPLPLPDTETPEGYVHFPQLGEDYFKQLTAENLAVRTHPRTGFRSYEWTKIRDRNETLDCFVYARAVATVIGVDRWPDHRFENTVQAPQQPDPKAPPEEIRYTPLNGAVRGSNGKFARKKSDFWKT